MNNNSWGKSESEADKDGSIHKADGIKTIKVAPRQDQQFRSHSRLG